MRLAQLWLDGSRDTTCSLQREQVCFCGGSGTSPTGSDFITLMTFSLTLGSSYRPMNLLIDSIFLLFYCSHVSSSVNFRFFSQLEINSTCYTWKCQIACHAISFIVLFRLHFCFLHQEMIRKLLIDQPSTEESALHECSSTP